MQCFNSETETAGVQTLPILKQDDSVFVTIQFVNVQLFFLLKFQTKGSSTNAALTTYLQYSKHDITNQKKQNMNAVYIIYIVNQTK